MSCEDSPEIQQIGQEPELDQEFYLTLLQTEERHSRSPSQKSVQQLTSLYSDCIHYFELCNEPVSHYFQQKMKKLIVSRRKKEQFLKVEKDLQAQIKIITSIPVEYFVEEHVDTVGKYEKKVSSIIDQQKQEVTERRVKKRRDLTKTSSLTMSMDSLFDSPQRRDNRFPIYNKTKLFETLIDDQDDENS